MGVPRFFVASPLDHACAGQEMALPDAVAHHACRVLRLAAGDPLTLFDGRGGEVAATLTHADRRGARVRLERFSGVERESPLRITLVQGIAATDAMDHALRMAVELGVAEIRPVVATRGARMPAGEHGEKRLAHWRQIAVAACEQCGRNRVPAIHVPTTFPQWLSARDPARAGFLLAPDSAAGLSSCPVPAENVDLAIGPEGGWTAEEIAFAVERGMVRARFGPRVLRTETAAAAVLGAVVSIWGDGR